MVLVVNETNIDKIDKIQFSKVINGTFMYVNGENTDTVFPGSYRCVKGDIVFLY